jgi:N-acetylglucosaminyl-diphospho-decaprenol L-rhamnosyltransferase
MGADVAAVVVTHESAGFLPACLDSLAGHAGGLELSVVVADSASTDEVESICREKGAIFLAGPNRGFGAALNRALGHDAVRRARYVLALNPDVEIVDGSLAEFVGFCDRRPECGVFGARQIDQHGRLIRSIGREPSPANYWWDWRTGWPTWNWDVEAHGHEARCDWVSGAFMLIRREVLETIGGFDERFFLYSEEVDLCTTVRRNGWEVGYLPHLTIQHWKADRPVDDHRERLLMWSELIYMRKWYRRRDRISMRVALVARLTRRLLRRLRSRETTRGEWIRLCAALRFRRRRYGPFKRGAAKTIRAR